MVECYHLEDAEPEKTAEIKRKKQQQRMKEDEIWSQEEHNPKPPETKGTIHE